MNFLKTIQERQLIHESWMSVLFGETLDDVEYWMAPESDFIRLSRDISFLYFGLMQCYCFAKAQVTGCLIRELPLHKDFVRKIMDMWDVEIPNRFSSTEELFSYLMESAKVAGKDVFGPDAHETIVEIQRKYTKLSRNSRANLDVMSRESFLRFLMALPLLRTTSLDPLSMKIRFTIADKVTEIKCSPFITFLSFESGSIGDPVDRLTENCYILTSVAKGDKNGELYFDTVGLNVFDWEIGRQAGGVEKGKKRICREVGDNENLKLLCRNAGIETSWYSADACWCDLKFLNRIVEASENVLLTYCGINREKEASREIQKKIRLVLCDSKSFTQRWTNEVIRVDQLNSLLFEMFLEDGLFKTVRAIMLNAPHLQKASSKAFFKCYMQMMIEAGIITAVDHDRLEKQCMERIAISLEKLSHIVSQTTPVYKQREREIRAEWKAFYVLKAAGIKTDSLFADVESILSIDDYYDMIITNEGSPEQDLKQVLRMLCVFYETLMENQSPFDEEKYFKDMERIAPKYRLSEHSVDQFFESFMDIAGRSKEVKHMNELLGRTGIEEKLGDIRYQYNRILTAKSDPCEPRFIRDDLPGCSAFISYAHEDVERVKPIVERWREMGYKLFFDETDLHIGDNWIDVAYSAMEQPSCKMVVVFVSKNAVRKPSVVKELEHAKALENSKRVGCKEPRNFNFIIPINLEEENTEEYLHTIGHDPTVEPNKQKQKAAREFAKYIDGDIVFLSESDESFERKFRMLYEERTNADGRVVMPYSVDPLKLEVANFYAFLKYGKCSYKEYEEIDEHFNDENGDLSRCIYPIVASIKETQFKRDNIAIVGYEMIRGKGRHKSSGKRILTSKRMEVNDYYCIPKYRSDKETRNWMVDPLLIRCDRFLEILAKAGEREHEEK